VSRPALAARGLVRRFEDLTAVRNVSLELQAGEVLGLLGPNGAGKTTILRMLAGILAPNEGTVTVMGLDTQMDPLGARRQIRGFVCCFAVRGGPDKILDAVYRAALGVFPIMILARLDFDPERLGDRFQSFLHGISSEHKVVCRRLLNEWVGPKHAHNGNSVES
jgi:ABC-type iron transport system FetAB ATPase subunit